MYNCNRLQYCIIVIILLYLKKSNSIDYKYRTFFYFYQQFRWIDVYIANMPNKALLLNRILYIYIYFSNLAANLSKIYLRPITSSYLSKGQLMVDRAL